MEKENLLQPGETSLFAPSAPSAPSAAAAAAATAAPSAPAIPTSPTSSILIEYHRPNSAHGIDQLIREQHLPSYVIGCLGAIEFDPVWLIICDSLTMRRRFGNRTLRWDKCREYAVDLWKLSQTVGFVLNLVFVNRPWVCAPESLHQVREAFVTLPEGERNIPSAVERVQECMNQYNAGLKHHIIVLLDGNPVLRQEGASKKIDLVEKTKTFQTTPFFTEEHETTWAWVNLDLQWKQCSFRPQVPIQHQAEMWKIQGPWIRWSWVLPYLTAITTDPLLLQLIESRVSDQQWEKYHHGLNLRWRTPSCLIA